jgi:large subunit ribosomal protein L29
MPKKNQFQDQTVDELKARHRDLSREIFDQINELKTHRKLEKPHLLRMKKRERAAVLTTIRQKGG